MTRGKYGLTPKQLQQVLNHPDLGPLMREIIKDVQRNDQASLIHTLQQSVATGLLGGLAQLIAVNGGNAELVIRQWANSAGEKWDIPHEGPHDPITGGCQLIGRYSSCCRKPVISKLERSLGVA
jgi:hypothetical protein